MTPNSVASTILPRTESNEKIFIVNSTDIKGFADIFKIFKCGCHAYFPLSKNEDDKRSNVT